jgi:hypothetical protein
MEQKLAEELIVWLQSSRQFITKQSPEVIQELIRWAWVSNIVQLMLAMVFVAVTVALILKGVQASKKDPYDYESRAVFLLMASGLPGIISLIMICDSVSTLIKVYTAPKLYVLQQLSHLVK